MKIGLWNKFEYKFFVNNYYDSKALINLCDIYKYEIQRITYELLKI